MKHMLLYRWSNCCESSVSSTLYGMGYHIDSLTGSMSDYDNDENMKAAFFSYFQQCEEAHFECSFVFSIDYFPLISNICDSRNVIYNLQSTIGGGNIFGINLEDFANNKFNISSKLFCGIEFDCDFE